MYKLCRAYRMDISINLHIFFKLNKLIYLIGNNLNE